MTTPAATSPTSGTTQWFATPPLNAALPSVADGDLMILLAFQRSSNSATIILPAAWTENSRESDGASSSAVFAHRVAHSEPGSYSIGFGSSPPQVVGICGITHFAAIRDVAFLWAAGRSGTLGPVGSLAGDLLVGVYCCLNDGDAPSMSIPSGYTVHAGANAGGIQWEFITKTATGPETAQSFTVVGGSDPTAWFGSLWALSGDPLPVTGGWGVGQIRMGTH